MAKETEKTKRLVMRKIAQHIDSKGLTRNHACAIIGVDKSRLSRLFNDQPETFSLDALLSYAIKLDMKVDVSVE